MKLLKEPEAAALAYGLLQRQPQLVLVFDLGGGTFDVSVLEVGGGFVEVGYRARNLEKKNIEPMYVFMYICMYVCMHMYSFCNSMYRTGFCSLQYVRLSPQVATAS